MKPIIVVSHLSKKFSYGDSPLYYTFRDSLTDIFKSPLKLFNKEEQLKKDEFWALKDVSFKVNEGEVLGVIGPNGSGKSTLLKILSKITPPSQGKVILRGRVGSLLEVGTGFHQELSGRENIYLNGAILGMTRREIKRKFDEIIDFSGVEKFLDTPVKHYSSGMYVRLAFAVAAHLEPEILLVDEVLAVGDAEFQKKCLNKMNEISKGGRTIIFVSHNMSAIKSLCTRCVMLKNGNVFSSGRTREVIRKYENIYSKAEMVKQLFPLYSTNKLLKILDFQFCDANGKQTSLYKSGEKIYWSTEMETKLTPSEFNYVIGIENEDGVRVACFTSKTSIKANQLQADNLLHLEGEHDGLLLPQGRYSYSLGIRFNNETILYIPNFAFFDVENNDHDNYINQNGVLHTISKWQIHSL